MNRRLLSLVAAVFVALLPTISTAETGNSATALTTISIDGVQAGAVIGWEGGDARASVVAQSPTVDGTVPKHPASVSYAPLVLKCPFPPSAPVLAWIGELCANKAVRKGILLTDYDAMGTAIEATEFLGAHLAEVRFPALDATAGSLGSVELVFAVEQSRPVTPAASQAPSPRTPASAGFRLVVQGLDATGVIRIESFTVSQATLTGGTGETRVATVTVAPLAFSNITVTLSKAKSATWRTWFTDFVINGNSGDGNERSGSIELLDSTMKSALLTLSFQRMGIIRLSRIADAAGGIAVEQAELYFEKLSIGALSATSEASNAPSQEETGGTQGDTGGVSTGKEGTAEGESVQPVEALLMEMPPPVTATGMLSGSTATAGAITPMDKSIAGVTTSPTTAGTVASTTSTAVTNTNPADQGSRDPAGFPRVSGLTRLDFSGQYHTTSTSEEAHYTTPDKIYDVLARVDAAAKAAGWTLAHFAEGYSQGGKWVTGQWKKDNSGVALQIDQPDTGVTRYWIRVTTQIPEAN